MPFYFAKLCKKFTFREFSEGMSASPRRFSEPEEHCSRFWFISLKTDAGVHLRNRASRGKISLRKTSSSSSCRLGYISRPREDSRHQRREFATNARNPCVIRLIVL